MSDYSQYETSLTNTGHKASALYRVFSKWSSVLGAGTDGGVIQSSRIRMTHRMLAILA